MTFLAAKVSTAEEPKRVIDAVKRVLNEIGRKTQIRFK